MCCALSECSQCLARRCSCCCWVVKPCCCVPPLDRHCTVWRPVNFLNGRPKPCSRSWCRGKCSRRSFLFLGLRCFIAGRAFPIPPSLALEKRDPPAPPPRGG